MFRNNSIVSWRKCIATCVVILSASTLASAQVVDANGQLDAEALLALDVNGNGVRDIFELYPQFAGKGVAFFRLDGERPNDVDGATGGANSAGPDGFRDAGLSFFVVPDCDSCRDLDLFFVSVARSPINTGKLTIIYLADSSGNPYDLGGDDSLLYVGMDIFNGFPYPPNNVLGDPGGVENVNWHTLDFVDTDALDDFCEDGVADYDLNLLPDMFGVPFDVDGDGDPIAITRWEQDGDPDCDALLDADADNDFEEYRLWLYVCPPGDFPTDRTQLGYVQIASDFNEFNVALTKSSAFNVAGVQFETFPPEGTDIRTLDISDVEFVIRGVDTLIDELYPATDYQIDRLRIANGGVQTRSDSNADSSAEDKLSGAWFLPVPLIEVTKEIRCVETGEPNAPNEWRETAEALPGSVVEFKIEVENTGNIPLAVTLDDVLEAFGSASFTVDPTFLDATLYRPSDGAGEAIVFPGSIPDGLNGTFFSPDGPGSPGFLGGVAADPPEARYLGVLNPIDVCTDPDNVELGDRVVLVFRATVDAPPGCDGQLDVDIRNSITAIGDPDVPPVSDGNEVFDNPDVIDTYREEKVNDPAADDNVVEVNLLCRSVTFEKQVQVCTDCSDIPGSCGEFVSDPNFLQVPAGPFPVCVRYRYVAKNLGEVSENASISEEFLCADVAAVTGVELVDCPVCPGPVTKDLAPYDPNDPNDPACVLETFCTVRFDTLEGLQNFLEHDDGAGRTCGDLTPPPYGETDPECYTNCAGASFDATDLDSICDSADAIDVYDTATICSKVCHIDVTKRVICIDCETRETIGDWTDPNDPNDMLELVPGSCVRFEVAITNENNSPPVCQLDIIDSLEPGQPGDINFDDREEFMLRQADGTELPCSVPAGFNVTGTQFEWVPADCGAALFEPNDVLTFTFDAKIPGTANPDDPDPYNEVEVRCYSVCPGEPGDWVPARVDLDILRPSITCTKEWQATWDSDADCEPGPALLPDPLDPNAYTDSLDLSEAVFPVELKLRVTVTNDGEVPLDATALDQTLCDCVDATAGASFVGYCVLCDPSQTERRLDPNDSTEYFCSIRVDTAAAMREMALNTCDGGSDDNKFENTVTTTGAIAVICDGDDVSSDCSAEIIPPPECSFEVTKQVECIDCVTGDVIDPPGGGDLDIGPGACARFTITVENTGTVNIPRVAITDDLTCNGWFVTGSVEADIDGFDVTPCVSPKFDNALPTGARKFYVFGDYTGYPPPQPPPACRPAAPWIAPTETLTIAFDVQVPEGFSTKGVDPDCVNHVTVEGFTEVCVPSPLADDACDEANAEAEINVLVPEVNCVKKVSADFGNDGSIEIGPTTKAVIDPNSPLFQLPLALIYDYTANNTGELPLNTTICDQIICDAAAFAGALLDPLCELDPITCCKDLGPVNPGNSESTSCEIVFTTNEQLMDYLDFDGHEAGEEQCLTNIATVTGLPIYEDICPPLEPIPVSSDCWADVCTSSPEPNCPPLVKAMAYVWNENEVGFSGTERCIWSWDQRLLSEWTADTSAPNHFLLTVLQTNRGRARIDGVRSVVVCGPESMAAPFLGVAAKIIDFGGNIAMAGLSLAGAGTEAGTIFVTVGPDGGKSNQPGQDDYGTPDPLFGPWKSGGDNSRISVKRADTAKKGSLLVFPKVEIKWNASGQVIQDTFLTLANDELSSVEVKLYFVNGNAALCNWVNNGIELTHDQPAYWSALTGQPLGVSPFTVLDPPAGTPDPDPLNPGGTVLRGYVLAWAINGNGDEIRWNHLQGSATLVNHALGTAWEYGAWSFQAVTSQQGQPLNSPFGRLDLDGAEYDFPPSKLLLDFFAPGAVLISEGGMAITVQDTDLTLWAAYKDFTY